jgi:RimJ/RimL family protein N-acetyltransferase
MLIEAEASDFALLLAGSARPPFVPVPESELAPPPVLQMLADLAASIRPAFAPSAWMIVEDGEVAGLLSAVRPPADGELHIGYGIAPSRHGRGLAGRAVAELVAWAAADPRVARVTAETAVGNLPSQRVLERNGFRTTGCREDAEDGPVLIWQIDV